MYRFPLALIRFYIKWKIIPKKVIFIILSYIFLHSCYTLIRNTQRVPYPLPLPLWFIRCSGDQEEVPVPKTKHDTGRYAKTKTETKIRQKFFPIRSDVNLSTTLLYKTHHISFKIPGSLKRRWSTNLESSSVTLNNFTFRVHFPPDT